jgi:acyl-coenzyme A synthetase/AMP-(fatty) acid ligase
VRRFLRHEYTERLLGALPGLTAAQKGQIFVKEAPYLRSIWLDDPTGCPWADSIDELMAKGAAKSGPAAEVFEALQAEVMPTDEAVMIYTSGTTSLPKAVVHAQRSIAEHSKVLADHFLIKETDRMMPLLPLFWVGGLTIALELMLHGGTLIYGGNPATEAVVENIIKFRANRINTWGPQLGRLRQAASERGIDINTIGGLAPQFGPDGQPIPVEFTANMLGMTESFGPHSSEPMNTVLPPHRKGSSGRATNDYERRVADPETGEILPPGQKGELQLRSGGLMKGYYKVDPRQLFTRDGFYPTGDLVRIEEDGHLYFEGRRGDMLKTAGANVSRLEVEAALRTIPEVGLPIVVGLPDAEAGQIVVAAVVPAEGAAPTEEALRDALREKLSNYKIPKHIVVIAHEDVQWTPSNKVRLADMEKLLAKRLGR